MDCKEEKTKPHPDYGEVALFYCDTHYEQVKTRAYDTTGDESEDALILLSEKWLIAAFEGRAGDVLVEKLLTRLKQEQIGC